jgi:hypothetical protein
MIVLSHLTLKNIGQFDESILPMYSVAAGLLCYSVVYVYLLTTNSEYLQFFNKFLIYIVGIDLLASTFINIKQKKAEFLENPMEDASDSSSETSASMSTISTGYDDNDEVDGEIESEVDEIEAESEADEIEVESEVDEIEAESEVETQDVNVGAE